MGNLQKNETFEIKKPEESKVNIYWAPAKVYQIANFVPERQLESGKIIQREVPIRFMNHIYQTSIPAEIKFIEDCDAFDKTENTGQIKKCDNIAMAHELTAGIAVMRSVKTIETTETNKVNY